MFQTFTIPAAGRLVNAQATFFRYETADPAAVDQAIRVRADGQDLGSYLPGDGVELTFAAKEWEFKPASGGDAAVVRVGMGRISSTRIVASLSGAQSTNIVTNKAPQATVTQSQKTVTSSSAQLLAANASRQYLLVQNKDSSGTVYLVFGGAAATTALGLAIPPGGYFEWNGTVPLGEVRAIGNVASNTNVVTLEG